jgi:large subunit ribosomal protein L29
MNALELRRLDREELAARVRELRDEVFNVRIKHATGQLETTSRIRAQKRELARALTVSREKGWS